MEGYIAQIKLFAPDFAPRNWALCQGQIMNIAQNAALFSLLGTTYGGNGSTTFALPDFRGRTPIGTGNSHVLGEMSGTDTMTLTSANLPAHTHTISGTVNTKASSGSTNEAPAGAYWGTGANNYANAKNGTMNAGAVSPSLNVANAGNNQPINNAQPSLCMNFIICLYGMFPSRN
ncbi:MAG: phage tail protein [Bacteroidia bacterium]